MIWEKDQQDLELKGFVKELICVRKQIQEILIQGDMTWQSVDDKNEQLYLTRHFNQQTIHAYFNQGTEAYMVDLENDVLFSQNCDILKDGKAEIHSNGFLILC